MLIKAPRQWVASPLGFNMLLTMFKENSRTTEKYKQIAKVLENTEGCSVKNKIFASTSQDISNLGNSTSVETTDFSKNENSFTVYLNKKYGSLKYHEFSSKTELIYANVSTFESHWLLKKPGLVMKLYNSYNYADDIRYEGRLLELPLVSEDFKFVLVLPNEREMSSLLFSTLTNQGLAATIRSIQPLFTAQTVLKIPMNIDVVSKVQIKEKISAIPDGLAIQYGTVAVSDIGIRVKVLTCIYSPASTEIIDKHFTLTLGSTPSPPPFYFAVVYQDTPIFYGDFNRRIF